MRRLEHPSPSSRSLRGTRVAVALLVGSLVASVASAGPPPPPRNTPPPPPALTPGPPPPVVAVPVQRAPWGPPGVVVRPVPAPPPLPVVLRVIYAPFYAAGLILRYGLYYTIVAPLEVLGRTLSYGVEGGVERQAPVDP
jgi:hypothetical protein